MAAGTFVSQVEIDLSAAGEEMINQITSRATENSKRAGLDRQGSRVSQNMTDDLSTAVSKNETETSQSSKGKVGGRVSVGPDGQERKRGAKAEKKKRKPKDKDRGGNTSDVSDVEDSKPVEAAMTVGATVDVKEDFVTDTKYSAKTTVRKGTQGKVADIKDGRAYVVFPDPLGGHWLNEEKWRCLHVLDGGEVGAEISKMITVGGQAMEIEDDDIIHDAKATTALRAKIKDEEPGTQGPKFERSVWEFYLVKAHFSDPMCGALNKASTAPVCCLPLCWPVRLLMTMRRAAPLHMRICRCCACNMRTGRIWPLVMFIFLLPIVGSVGFFDPFRTAIRETLKEAFPDMEDPPMFSLYVAGFTLAWAVFMCVFWWARVLMVVSLKYYIYEAIHYPKCFMCKTMAYICCMSYRISLHVDRAQGFRHIEKKDKITLEIIDNMHGGVRVRPFQSEMV